MAQAGVMGMTTGLETEPLTFRQLMSQGRAVGLAAACLTLAAQVLAMPGAMKISGTPKPLSLTTADLAQMPRTSITATAHKVSGTFEGVTIRELLTRAGVPAGPQLRGAALASSVIVTGADGYRVSFGLAEFDPDFTDRVAILADKRDGEALPPNAAPFQLILSGEKRPARWVRQVISIELVPAIQ